MALAQTPTQPPVTKTSVTVSATTVPVEASAADVTLLGRDEVAAAQPQTLGDVLRLQPSIYVSQTGPRGGLTAVSLRGGDPNFTLFLLDGVPVNDITDELGGTVDLAAILPFRIERVEIVRGAMSSVWGSEAVAGVINVITESKEAAHWSAGFSAGNFGTFEGRISTGGQRGRLTYSGGVAGLRIGEQVERDSLYATDGSGRLGIELSKSSSLAFLVRVRDSASDEFPANSGGPLYALNRALESRGVLSGAGSVVWRAAMRRISYLAEADVFGQRQNIDTPAILDRLPPSFRSVPATVSHTRFRQIRTNAAATLELLPRWLATVGFSYRYESGESQGTIMGFGPAVFRRDRNTAGYFGETVYEGKRWSVIAGVRLDRVTDGVSRVSPRLGASVATPWSGGRFRVSWGRGFKNPSFYALAHPFIGNPLLRPETSESVDGGLEQRLGRRLGTAGVNVFRTEYGDLIDFSAQLFRLVNRSAAIARGADAQWRIPIVKGADVTLHATYVALYLRDPLKYSAIVRAGAAGRC
jgi:outer membrane cobalamin receptor